MHDIIQLLPDHIANQIAAGEVIQRPASAVKELMENAIDAGANSIQLIVNDAGKALVQVIDNGKGMSATDARMAFERHATSKIATIEDLFHIRTMGFRGEALASIAAVAQVEVKTRRELDEAGTYLSIENSTVQIQEPIACSEGTSIAMKNVFFNVPARRNFLKSNTTELKNIIEEFTRIALGFPAIHFSMKSNGQQVFFLEKGSAKQRIVQLLGNVYNKNLVAVNEETNYLNIFGFVGKPETARKTRGDQFLFANQRYIKSAYLNHAIAGAFSDLIAKDSFPAYVLFLELDPQEIDINVHPTKQEIKFTDEKLVYAFVQSAVKHALAQYSISPSLDFSLNADIQQLEAINRPFTADLQEKTIHSGLYQTFLQKNQAHAIEPSNYQPWSDTQSQQHLPTALDQQQLDTFNSDLPFTGSEISTEIPLDDTTHHGKKTGWQSELAKLKNQFFNQSAKDALYDLDHEMRPMSREKRFQWLADTPLLQIHATYIVAITNQGYLLIHQHYAHERVMYEQLQKALHGKPMATQQSLFPVTFDLPPTDAVLLRDLLPDLQQLGYQLSPFGANTFVVQGTPADVAVGNEQKVMEQLLEQYKHFNSEVKFSKREKLIRTLAKQQCIKPGRPLIETEMRSLIDQLFMCTVPNATPNGKATYVTFSMSQLEGMFQR